MNITNIYHLDFRVDDNPNSELQTITIYKLKTNGWQNRYFVEAKFLSSKHWNDLKVVKNMKAKRYDNGEIIGLTFKKTMSNDVLETLKDWHFLRQHDSMKFDK